MKKCAKCGGEAKYIANGEQLCRDCTVAEYGLCAVCANRDTCEDKGDGMIIDLCSEFEQ